MPPDPPWRRHDALVHLTASWQRRLAGRDVFRVVAGPGWLRLSFAGEPRFNLQFTVHPGAVLLWDTTDAFPVSCIRAMGRTSRPPVASLLSGRRLLAASVLPADRVVVLAFQQPPSTPLSGSIRPSDSETESGATRSPDQADRFLLQQLFGSRGNLVILDRDGKIMWAQHRPPHRLLTETPAPDIFTFADEATAAELSAGRDDTVPELASQDIAAEFRTAALEHLTQNLHVAWHRRLSSALRRIDRSQQRLVVNLTRDLQNADRGDEHRRAAETLAAHLNEVPRGAHEVQLPSPHNGTRLRLSLNPALSATANMEHFFNLARKAARGRAVIAARLDEAYKKTTSLENMRQELENLATIRSLDQLTALLDWADAHGQDIGISLPKTAKSTRSTRTKGKLSDTVDLDRPFRRYLVEDRWEVWVGRNQRENDVLTHRQAAPNDWWFHAQGVTGSHVVLRTGSKPEQVPRRVIAKAAALAALHSKARHSSLVSVVYTLRKYVRKPRKTPAGTASYVQERSMMVAPGLMTGVKLI